jgi:hypothetical protein
MLLAKADVSQSQRLFNLVLTALRPFPDRMIRLTRWECNIRPALFGGVAGILESPCSLCGGPSCSTLALDILLCGIFKLPKVEKIFSITMQVVEALLR